MKDFRTDIDGNSNTDNGNGNNGGTGGVSGFPGGMISLPMGGGMDENEIAELLINMNEKCKDKKPIKFREREIFSLLSVLNKKEKSNAIIIGSAGVGKTALVEDVARAIEQGDETLPERLKDKVIYELPLSAIVAGTGIVGQLEEKVQDIVDFFEDPENKAILFMDEVHQLANDRDPSASKIAQILKPALSRGNIKMIGATTLQEKKDFLNDPALNRRFSEVICPELTREQTVEIIKDIKGEYSIHHKVVLEDGKENVLVSIADKNTKAGMHRPDNAITLMDTAMSDARLKTERLRVQAKNSGDTAMMGVLTRVPVLNEKQIEKSAKRLLDGKGENLDTESYKRFEKLMSEKLIGQEDAAGVIIDAIKRKTLGVFEDKKPLSFLLAGTTGCGKSHTGKIIAEGILGNAEAVININMTEYSSDMSITRIIGSPDGYVGSDSSRELPFDSLESNPRQVILLDEFEKGSKGVQRLFMQALDEGVVKTARGKEIDFSKCIIIATTNAGQVELSKKSLGFGGKGESKKTDLTEALASQFDKELLDRFTHLLQFKSITKEIFEQILCLKYKELVEEVNKSGLYTAEPAVIEDTDQNAWEWVKKTSDEVFDESLGARAAERTVRAYIEEKLLDCNGYTCQMF